MSTQKQSAYRVTYTDDTGRERRVMVVLKSPIPGGRWDSYDNHPAVAVLHSKGTVVNRVSDVKRMKVNVVVEGC